MRSLTRTLGLFAIAFATTACDSKGAAPKTEGSAVSTGHAPASAPASASASASPQAATHSPSGAPIAARRPVKDDYAGTVITDDYRWLEDSTAPEVKEWSAAQNKVSRAHLDAIAFRPQVKASITRLLSEHSADWFDLRGGEGVLFARKEQPPKQQALLVVLPSADDVSKERIILDPNALDASGKTAIDFYVPSRDKKLVAVSLSAGGSESGTVHVYEVDTGKERPDVVPRVNGGTAGGSVAWAGDGSGFFYTRYPREGERPKEDLEFFQQVYFHKLGTDTKDDTYSLGKELPRIAETSLRSSPDGKSVLASVRNGDGGDVAHYLASSCDTAAAAAKATWTKVADFADKHTQASFGADGALYMLSLAGAPKGKVVRLAVAAPQLAKEEVVVPEGDLVVQGFVATRSVVYVSGLAGGPSQLVAHASRPHQEAQEMTKSWVWKSASPVIVPTLPVSSVGQIVRLDGDDVLFRSSSFTEPPAFYRVHAADRAVTKTKLAVTSSADFKDAEVLRDTCTSRDGTKVPISIVRKKGAPLDGSNPTLLNGYGGYGVAMTPSFRPVLRAWLDQGGVYALANLRGGNELGDAWHRAGNLASKQNVFDDFAACGEKLIADKITRKDRLAAMGGSNGGLLMGAAMTQHPNLFRAIVSQVGIYDMLRVETDPNGAFNVTEFGSTKDPATLPALLAYSPYHHVTDGTAYPSVLFTTGANDRRVLPYHSRKMTARLQAATSSKNPIFLRTNDDAGHGMGTPLAARIEEQTDLYCFLFTELGIAVR